MAARIVAASLAVLCALLACAAHGKRGFDGLEYGGAVFHGTSITLGVRPGVTAAQALPVLVAASKQFVPAINAGLGGDTSTAGLARFERDVLAYQPAMISIEYGHNEAGAGINTTTFSANITEMVRKAKLSGARVTLFVPIYAQDSTLNASIAPYRTVMRNLAASLGCDLFDLYDDMVALDGATQNSYYIDSPGQHLSPAGLAWAAAKVGSGSYANSFRAAAKTAGSHQPARDFKYSDASSAVIGRVSITPLNRRRMIGPPKNFSEDRQSKSARLTSRARRDRYDSVALLQSGRSVPGRMADVCQGAS